jgi:DNA-binding ferritin-like protein (Dps family)
MNLTDKDLSLILDALESDKKGKWGDERHEKLNKLIKKLQKAGVNSWNY